MSNAINQSGLAACDADPARDGLACADFVPGRLRLCGGTAADYAALAAFHYRAGRPATWAAVVAVRHADGGRPERTVAVGVLSWPTALSRPRREVFGLDARRFGEQLRFANRCLRTVSRVVVHPQFRGLGLAVAVVRRLIDACPTRFVEASATMGAVVPMFERAGMTRHPTPPGRPAYFWVDKAPETPRPAPPPAAPA